VDAYSHIHPLGLGKLSRTGVMGGGRDKKELLCFSALHILEQRTKHLLFEGTSRTSQSRSHQGKLSQKGVAGKKKFSRARL